MNPRIFYFDDKNGGEIFVRACGAAVTDVAIGRGKLNSGCSLLNALTGCASKAIHD